MEYTITEASKMLKTSRVTIYKKIDKLPDLQGHITIKNNTKYVDVKGIEIIRSSLEVSQQCKEFTPKECKGFTHKNSKSLLEEDSSIDVNVFTSMQTTYINSLQDLINDVKKDKDKQIEDLNRQLVVKDTQLQSLTDALGTAQRLNENNQVLLQQSQQKVLFLEQVHSEKKSWWKKMFS